MTATTSIATTTRPPAFDEAVIRYIPGLRALAKAIAPYEEREDLVADTLAYVFRAWGNFRLDETGGYRGIHAWLTLSMRSIWQTKCRHVKQPVFGGDAYERACRTVGFESNHEGAIDARNAIASMPQDRDTMALLRLAGGETLEEIGRDMGISRERVRQVSDRARTKLRRRVGRAHAV